MSFSELPAHDSAAEVEGIAAAQLEAEKKEKPETAEQLIEATEDAVDSLAQRLVRNSLAYEYLTELSSRVQRYLSDSENGTPSLYAQALVASRDRTTPAQTASLAAIAGQIVSEINPLLFEIQNVIVEHNAMTQAGAPAGDILKKEGGLIDVLKTGSVGGQKTTSLFGFLEGLSVTQEIAPRTIVVVDPFTADDSNKQYWQDRMAVWQEVSGKKQKSYENLISLRSENAVFDLDMAAEEAEAKGDQAAAEAFITLAQYIENRIAPLTQNFKKTVRHLSFLDGQADDIFDFFNAVEIVKQKNPQLYARLLGVAPGRQSSEAERSDLFGNVFQIAFYRSAHRRVGAKGVVGRQVLNERLKGLAEMDTKQLPLRHINAEQMDALQAELKTELQKAPAEQNSILITSLIGSLVSRSRETNLHELLEAVSEQGEETQAVREQIEARWAKMKELRKLFKKINTELDQDLKISLAPLIISDQQALGMITKRRAKSAIVKAREAITTRETSESARLDLLCDLAEVEVKNGFSPEEILKWVKDYERVGYVGSEDRVFRVVNLEFAAGIDPSEFLEKVKSEYHPNTNKAEQAIKFCCALALLEFKMGKDPSGSLDKAKTFNANPDQGIDKKTLDAFFEIAMAEIKIGRDATETISKIIENSHWLDFDDQETEKILNLVSCQLEFGHDPSPLLTMATKKARTVKSLYKIAGFEAKHKLDFFETLEMAEKRGKHEPDAKIYKTLFFDSEIEIEDEKQLLQAIEKLKRLLTVSSCPDFSEALKCFVKLEIQAGLDPSRFFYDSFDKFSGGDQKLEIVKCLMQVGNFEAARKLMEEFRMNDYPAQVAFLKEIGKQAETLLEEEKHVDAREARELFGENFFGAEQVEKAFTIHDQNGTEVKLVDFSPEQRQHIEQMLAEKLNEPDIQTFLQKPENQADIKNGKYLLILRAPQVGSIKKMFELLQPDMEAKGQGKLLFKVDWYATDSLFTSTTCPFEWKFVTKEVVPSTLGLQHQPMTEALAAEARRVGFDPSKIKRRAPVETVFDFLTVLRTTNGRILLNKYDWSDIRSSGGLFVFVGLGDSGGLLVHRRTPDYSGGDLGASLSR